MFITSEITETMRGFFGILDSKTSTTLPEKKMKLVKKY